MKPRPRQHRSIRLGLFYTRLGARGRRGLEKVAKSSDQSREALGRARAVIRAPPVCRRQWTIICPISETASHHQGKDDNRTQPTGAGGRALDQPWRQSDGSTDLLTTTGGPEAWLETAPSVRCGVRRPVLRTASDRVDHAIPACCSPSNPVRAPRQRADRCSALGTTISLLKANAKPIFADPRSGAAHQRAATPATCGATPIGRSTLLRRSRCRHSRQTGSAGQGATSMMFRPPPGSESDKPGLVGRTRPRVRQDGGNVRRLSRDIGRLVAMVLSVVIVRSWSSCGRVH